MSHSAWMAALPFPSQDDRCETERGLLQGEYHSKVFESISV
jgi:hypothetical protein